MGRGIEAEAKLPPPLVGASTRRATGRTERAASVFLLRPCLRASSRLRLCRQSAQLLDHFRQVKGLGKETRCAKGLQVVAAAVVQVAAHETARQQRVALP